MNSIIEEIFRTGIVRDKSGNEYHVHSNIEKHEGEFIFNLISTNVDITRTLEVGCAFGLSSLFICSALDGRKSAKHTIIDPCQHEQWHGVGIQNLKRAGFNFFDFIEEPSEFILPEITQEQAGTFDFIFIDGWHTFDHTLLDLFYSNRLLKVGGYIVIDDCNFPGVAKAVSYMLTYPAYEFKDQCIPKKSAKGKIASIANGIIPRSMADHLIPRNLYDRFYIRMIFSTMVAMKKIKDDVREWDWFEPF